MTKEEIIDLFRQTLSGNRPTADNMIALAEAKLGAYLSIAYQSMIFNIVRYNPHSYTALLADYTYEETGLEVVTEGSKKLIKPKLQPMSVAAQEGVRAVFPSGQPESALTYRNANADWMMSELENGIGGVHVNGTYSVTANTISIKTPHDEVKTYDVRLIAEFFSLNSTDQVRLPMGGEVMLMEVARNMYLNSPRKDIANDSV